MGLSPDPPPRAALDPPPVGRFRTLLLLGTAHCGSTLLGRMLDRHSRVLCVGEALRWLQAVRKGFPCSCGAPLGECQFWGPRRDLLDRYGGNYRRCDRGFFDELARRSEAELVVDLSKTRVWRTRRRWLEEGARRDVGFVLLLRDSRGVLAAARRLKGGLKRAAPRHAKWIRRQVELVESEAERSHVLTYEGLCRDPEGELRRLLDFLGLPWEDALLRPADGAPHFVHASRSRYQAGSNELRLDERWRSDLSARDVRRVEAIMRRVPLLTELYLDPSSPRYQLG